MAGIICGVLALAIAIVLSVRFGTCLARNTSVFTTFDNCIAKAGNRTAVSNCIAASQKTSGRRLIPATRALVSHAGHARPGTDRPPAQSGTRRP
jgi:hypothetical protein